MRIVYALCTGLLSHVAVAQSDFQTGSYFLENDPTIRYAGLIGAGDKFLLVKGYQGKIVSYPWAEVRSYRKGNSRYVKSSGFSIYTGLSTREANNDFVELLDSGAVSLMRYEHPYSGGYGGVPAVGGFPGYPGLAPSKRPDVYLLQRAGEATPVAIPYSVLDGSGKKFREAVAPFVTSRPNLQKVLAAKKITIFSLQTFIHAFNHHEPFLNYPMESVQSNP